MRRLWLFAWPLVLCYFGLALTVFAKDSSESGKVLLRLSIRRDTLRGVPSCQHTFSQIELLNLHSTDHITIHSIQTAPEETIMIQSTSGIVDSSTWERVPQQLHIARLPQGSLSLGPGQVAIVPVTFLPSYPSFERDDELSDAEVKPLPSISSTVRVDLANLVGDNVLTSFDKKTRSYDQASTLSKRRNNLDHSLLPTANEFEVTTSIVVDTSRGALEMPVTASSLRRNPYSIPDFIRFHHSIPAAARESEDISTATERGGSSTARIGHDGVVIMKSIPFDKGVNEKGGAKTRHADTARDCYDVYLTNPSPDSDLEISEVLVSRPDLMSVEFDPNRLLLAPDLLVLPTAPVLPTGPSQVVREWTEEGPMYVPADSVDNYIVTVCTAPAGVESDERAGTYLEGMSNWIDSGSPELSLGFLQIRTDAETLFIALECFNDHQAQPRDSVHETPVALNSSPNISLEKASSALVKAKPATFNARLISLKSPQLFDTIALQNKSPVPIRIMRLSVSMDTKGNERSLEIARHIGLDFNVTRGPGGKSDEEKASGANILVLPAASTVKNAIFVTCVTWTGDPYGYYAHEVSFNFTGSIILRGTMDTDLSYEEWKKEMVRNPYRDTHLTIEIPYTLTVWNGRVEVIFERSTHPYPQTYAAQGWDRTGQAVASLFFPMNKFEATKGSDAPLPTQNYKNSREIVHDLRVMSNINVPVQLDTAEIVDSDGLPANETQSLCSRFNVTTSKRFRDSSNYNDFDDLGFLALQYKFAGSRDKSGEKTSRLSEKVDKDPILPTTCYLRVLTSPFHTGRHEVPLIIFPGQLEVTSSSHTRGIKPSYTGDTEAEGLNRNSLASVSMGYANLLAWFRSSIIGKSLLETFEGILEGRNNLQTDSQILTNYLLKLCHPFYDKDNSKLKPVLLKIGAIEQSEIARAYLFFTNRNPVPIILSIDVGEVEGMSISQGRDESQRRGDGDNLLDYLPNPDTSPSKLTNALVGKGSFAGHPVDGLRQFLMSNIETLDFSERFPFRDAVSISMDTMVQQPFLGPLYNWHSYVEFHRTQLPESFASNETATSCDSSVHPPQYISFDSIDRSLNKSRLPGAFMVSGDKKLARSLKVCSHRETENVSPAAGTQIKIPPGGTARFEVRVRSPPHNFLENDISQLLATGLVLSTSFGQVMPIFATFEALQGQLYASGREEKNLDRDEAVSEEYELIGETIVDVPLGLNWEAVINTEIKFLKRTQPLDSFPYAESSDSGVPLYLSSSFSRQIRLLDVDSCHPWFNVLLQNTDGGILLNANVGTNIGSLLSSASCLPESGDSPAYPSFYQCALNLMSQRHELQPLGCGIHTRLKKQRDQGEEDGLDTSHRGIRSILQTFEKALTRTKAIGAGNVITSSLNANGTSIGTAFSLQPRGTFNIKSGRKRSVGILDTPSLKAFAETWDTWNLAREMGLTQISSNLRATIAYDAALPNSAEDDSYNVENQSLSLSMQNLMVESSLKEPKLFAHESLPYATDDVGTFEFFPTLVGSTISMKIPLRNPTSVPIKVRLVAAPPGSETDKVPWPDNLRERFLQGLRAPHVQGSQEYYSQNNGQHLWWDGGGAFVFADRRGDVVRSHHNTTIRAGAGAHLSLVNPSLHAIVGFVTGCGVRCGVRDDSKLGESTFDPKHTSAFGAAAAAGITLIGRKRASLLEVDTLSSDEPFVFSGGTPVAASDGPSAFALPYSALDEIIIPPYGVGEIGPVFFRPPGRYNVLGCSVAKESEAIHWATKKDELCRKQEFESIVFLENSLTGIERVKLKGTSQWDHLYFLDPSPQDDESFFGDIELRNGRSTLVFSGSGNQMTEENGIRSTIPVMKEIVLHNGGDVKVEIASIYLSDTTKIWDKKWPSRGVSTEACMRGSFRLLDCWESEYYGHHVDGHIVQNMHAGFGLAPGESRFLFVEHTSDCGKQEEFISLNVDFAPRSYQPEHGTDGIKISTTSEGKTARKNGWTSPLQTKKIDLVMGYKMNQAEFSRCSPVNDFGEGYIINETFAFTPGTTPIHNTTRQRKMNRGRPTGLLSFMSSFFSLVSFISLIGLAAVIFGYWDHTRKESLERELKNQNGAAGEGKLQEGEKKRPPQQNLWNAAFRCLARADPNSAELQALGREQVRQVIAGRYRARGGTPPSSLCNLGIFTRDRLGVGIGGPSRPRSGKESGSGTERVRMLSDALFRNSSTEIGRSGRTKLPTGLGWRIAFARGIINEKSFHDSDVGHMASRLLNRRSRANASGFISEESIGSNPETEDDESEESPQDELDSQEDPELEEELEAAEEPNATGDEDAAGLWTTRSRKNAPASTESVVSAHKSPTSTLAQSAKSVKVYESHEEETKYGSTDRNEKVQSREKPQKQNGKPLGWTKAKPINAKKDAWLPEGSTRAAKTDKEKPTQIRPDSVALEATSVNHKGRRARDYTDKVPKGMEDHSSNEERQQSIKHLKHSDKAGTCVAGDDMPVPLSQKGTRTKNANEKKTKVTKDKKVGANAGVHSDQFKSKKTMLKEQKARADNSNLPARMSPPPGLAPPPGFGADGTGAKGALLEAIVPLPINTGVESASLGDMLTAALHSDLNLSSTTPAGSLPFSEQISNSSSDLLFAGAASENPTAPPVTEGGNLSFPLQPPSGIRRIVTSTVSTRGGHSDKPQASGDPLLDVLLLDDRDSSRNGFDVMDFLDSILDDTGGQGEEHDQRQDPASLLVGSSGPSDVPAMSKNPWATEKKSRASAYGISFDESEEVSSGASPGINGGSEAPSGERSGIGRIPLLTPSAILMSGQDNEGDDDDRALSFYGSLTDD